MSGHDEKDEPLRQPPDTLAAALEPTRSHDDAELRTNESDDEKGGLRRSLADKEIDGIEKIEERRADSTSDDNDADEGRSSDDRQRNQAHLTQTKSYATDTSAATGAGGNVEDFNREKSWLGKMNPLRWGKVPPIPEEPAVSREAAAGFWSLLTFTWMGPLMTVRCLFIVFLSY